MAGLATAFGSGAMTNSIHDIGDAACIFAIGTNTTSTHPVIGVEVKRATSKGGKLIVANPRQIGLTRFADLWLRHKPGTDVALLMGMCKVIDDEVLWDAHFIEKRTENFEVFQASLKKFDLDTVEKITGVPKEEIVQGKINALLISLPENKTINRLIANIKNADALSPYSLNIYDLLRHKNIILEEKAVNEIEKHYK